MKLNKKLIAVPAIALTAGLSLAACGSVKAAAAAPAVTHTVTAPAAAPKPTTPALTALAPAPAKTVYLQAPAAPAPVAPAAPALINCGGDLYAGADTSCPFALNVAADYTGLGADYAYSPVTGLDHTMSCDGGSGARDLVTCTGGDNALVEFYD
jgi:hypothetical protein